MEESYNQYFSQVMTGDKPAPKWTRSVGRFIGSIKPFGDHWRSDAIYFLGWNFYLMILEQIRVVQDITSIQELTSLEDWDLIEEDLETIIEEAEIVSTDRDRDYVSATSVAIALGNVAEDLRTTSLQIWGPRPNSE